MRHRILPACATALALAACASAPPPSGPVPLRLLAINDFHGNLEPPSGGYSDAGAPSVPAGGAEHLATAIAALRAQQRNTIVVAAGDLIGASPLISGLFHDEPSIESLTAMGLGVAAVGNHEFDEGVEELRRMQHGGCHPVDGCRAGRAFAGAGFQYLAASTVDRRTGETVFAPYAVREFDGVEVGFIGLTLEGTPAVILSQYAEALEFRDEAETVNALVPDLRAQGVEAIVVLIHEGGTTDGPANSCDNFSGAIVGIVEALDPAVDIVVTGHTHQAYVCRIDGRLVTGGGRYGMMLTQIDAALDPSTGDIIQADARNLIVAHADYGADPAQTELLAAYRAAAAPLVRRVIGAVAAPLNRSQNGAGESALGDVIADAQLAASPGAQIALMNPGGVREDISGAPDGTVTFADILTAQPFGNTLITMTLTGAEIDAVLEQQFSDPDYARVLQVSEGFSYVWDDSRPVGDKVGALALNGAPIDPERGYRIVTNNFLAGGGDGFTGFGAGRDTAVGVSDIEALEAYFAAHSPVAPGPQDRIRRAD